MTQTFGLVIQEPCEVQWEAPVRRTTDFTFSFSTMIVRGHVLILEKA